ncbi:DUF2958 domain-containing protein [Thalassococcus lentus]|uniref:DUF2958 domain-containing protein n=1 Tax=Thalassococcus lentus TaxID=1210524 RepID=A0ABT4XUU7_9RHOB|nr:DUF2958 domain-containing protein [Thalassococcus lentus]MDA7425701.1 DUF2958 domain-containing protein [Thalassococcus lentus]
MKKLITKEILQKLIANDELSQIGMNRLDMVPVLRLFTPDAAATWVLVSGEEVEGDVILYGCCDLGLGFQEFGNVSLRELQTVRGKLGLPVERDLYFRPTGTLHQMSEDAEAANAIGL